MREHCCKSCDYCLEYFNGYDFEYYCLKWDEEPNAEYCFDIIDVFDSFERAIRCDEENYCGYDRIKIIKKNLIVS